MKKFSKIFIFIFLVLIILYFLFGNSRYNGKNQVVANCTTCSIKTELEAVNRAEDILFRIYGKSKIIEERPYNIKLVDNKKWIIEGSLNKNLFETILFSFIPKFGGCFEIMLDAQTGEVINVTHYK